MFTFLIVIEVIISIVLILVILMQSSKGGGLAGTFGGGNVGMVFGVRRTADFLIRATQILAGTFIVLSLVINIFFLPRSVNTQSVLEHSGVPQKSALTRELPPSQQAAQQSGQQVPAEAEPAPAGQGTQAPNQAAGQGAK
jgi:preprotein translocase subunit SecG